MSSASQSQEPLATWNILKPLLKAAARDYKTKHKRIPVLVIDASDLLARKNLEFLKYFQAFAKKCADSGSLRFVFVFSYSAELLAFLHPSNSATSRLSQVVKVGDITDDAAIDYMTSRFRVDDERAKEMVTTITGGRLALLNMYGKEHKDSPVQLRGEINTRIEKSLEFADVPSTSPFFQQLVSSPNNNLTLDENMKCCGITWEQIQKLDLHSVIAIHPYERTVTFGNRHVEVFIRSEVEKAKESRGYEMRK